MEVLKGVSLIGLGVYIKSADCLVLADFHIGYEEALNKQGVLVPRFSFQDIVAWLKPLKHHKLIVVNGDIKHEFGAISQQEWTETLQILDILKSKSGRLVLIKGNHDTILEPLAKRKDVEILDLIKVGGFLITHGHRVPDANELKGVQGIIIGHEHPAVTLREGVRTELFKCFLVGNYKRKPLIVMPSSNLLTPGTDVLKEKLLSPFLRNGISSFDVYIVEKKVYFFGKTKDLLRGHTS